MSDDSPVISPPASMTVDVRDKQPVLYDSHGIPLVRRPAGFDTSRVREKKRN